MVHDVANKFPSSKLVLVGFSMGGNIITKYLGETNKIKPAAIIGGLSICQGYDVLG